MIGSEKNLVGGAQLDAEQRCYFLETAMFYPRAATRAARPRRRARILSLINGFG
jgi:hypothetical protein